MKYSMNLMRVEYFFLFLLSIFLTVYFWNAIVLWQYALLVIAVDMFGYYPGRLWGIFKKTQNVPQVFSIIYNACHNLTVIVIVSIIWHHYFIDNFSFIALFAHLFFDRGILGNFPKSSRYEFTLPAIKY